MTITEFLLARIAEDKARAERWRQIADDVGRLYGDPEPPEDDMNPADRAYFAMHDASRRVLAECEAKRRIVELLDAEVDSWDELSAANSPEDWLAKQVAKALAAPYADHPQFRPEWRPGS